MLGRAEKINHACSWVDQRFIGGVMEWALSCRGLHRREESGEGECLRRLWTGHEALCRDLVKFFSSSVFFFFWVPLQSDPEISSPRTGSGGEASALGLSIVSFRILAPRRETNSQGFKKLTGSWNDRDVTINAGKSSAEASLHRSAAIISQC